MIILVTSGMIVNESGLYQSIDETFRIFLNKGDKVPEINNEFHTLKLVI